MALADEVPEKERSSGRTHELIPRDWEPSADQPLPTRRHGEILPPGASRRGRYSSALTAIPAWIIFGLIWWRAIVEQPDQLAIGAIIWGGCAVFTSLVILGWVAWNRALAHRRVRKYGGRSGAPEGDIGYARDALGRAVSIEDGAHEARHVRARVTDDGAKKIETVSD